MLAIGFNDTVSIYLSCKARTVHTPLGLQACLVMKKCGPSYIFRDPINNFWLQNKQLSYLSQALSPLEFGGLQTPSGMRTASSSHWIT